MDGFEVIASGPFVGFLDEGAKIVGSLVEAI
jgi:hypothetical protein